MTVVFFLLLGLTGCRQNGEEISGQDNETIGTTNTTHPFERDEDYVQDHVHWIPDTLEFTSLEEFVETHRLVRTGEASAALMS